MAIKLRGNKVAIEKIKKAPKGKEGFLVLPDNEEYLGTVMFVGETASKDIAVGQKVFFSTDFQTVRMNGKDYCVIDDNKVFAIVTD